MMMMDHDATVSVSYVGQGQYQKYDNLSVKEEKRERPTTNRVTYKVAFARLIIFELIESFQNLWLDIDHF